ncbi:MAG: class I SAM-dependent methyltransferase [Nibricoccus sp.]
MSSEKITSSTVRADFNDPVAVVHYTRAAHFLGLWKSERILIERIFSDKSARLLEAGCGSGRVTLGLWQEGYQNLAAFDFAEELLQQARALAADRGAQSIRFFHADATRLSASLPKVCHPLNDKRRTDSGENGTDDRHLMDDKAVFDGALFMFNGLMQIPGRENRRAALRELHKVCRVGARLLFTTHDRDGSTTEKALWRLEALRWSEGLQDSRLVEFGDRYFEDENGRTFMHLPNRTEILDDLVATGWNPTYDAMRVEIARETKAVQDFSDECRFWIAERT